MEIITKAINLLKEGHLIAMPTETVYGLAGNAYCNIACSKIYKLKKRPNFNPLIVHVKDLVQASDFAEISDLAGKLVKKYWPGPLTLILPQKTENKLSEIATASYKTVAVRCPSHPIAQQILNLLDFPLAAPSANISNYISPTHSSFVLQNFSEDELFIVPGDQSKIGLESTILDISNDDQVKVLRHGAITLNEISVFLGQDVIDAVNVSNSEGIIAPGMLKKHYSPKCFVKINADLLNHNEVGLNFGSSNLKSEGSLNLSVGGDLREAASNLYAYLYKLEQYVNQHPELDTIAIAPIPNKDIGVAINDRIKRAAVN